MHYNCGPVFVSSVAPHNFSQHKQNHYGAQLTVPLRRVSAGVVKVSKRTVRACQHSGEENANQTSLTDPATPSHSESDANLNQQQQLEPSESLNSHQSKKSGGFGLMLEDIANIRSFFSQFMKPRSTSANASLTNTSHENESSDERAQASNEMTYDSQWPASTRNPVEPSDGRASDSPTEVKSRIGNRIVENYVAARGAVERAWETASIAAQSALNVIASVAGGTVNALKASSERFSGLGLNKAKGAISEALRLNSSNTWSPLDAFDWQTVKGSTPEETRQLQQASRRQRILNIASQLRGTSSSLLGKLWLATTAGIKAFATIAEATAPKLVGKAHALGSAAIDDALNARGANDVSETGSTTFMTDKAQYRHSGQSKITKVGRGYSTRKRPRAPRSVGNAVDSDYNTEREQLRNDVSLRNAEGIWAETEISGGSDRLSSFSSGDKSTNPTSSPLGAGSIITGAALVGAGALVSTAVGASISTIVTCSALAATAVVVSEARKSAFNTVAHQRAQRLFRQSKSVRRMEEIISNASDELSRRNDEWKKLGRSAGSDGVTRYDGESGQSQDDGPFTIDSAAYRLESSEAWILSIPVVGEVLKVLDVVAFSVETIMMRVWERVKRMQVSKRSKEWVMLSCFEKNADK